MKCMCVPANLSEETWTRLFLQQIETLRLREPRPELIHDLFGDGLTVNEAISTYIQVHMEDDGPEY